MSISRPEWRLKAEARAAEIGLVLPPWMDDAELTLAAHEIEAKESMAMVSTPRLSACVAKALADIQASIAGNRFLSVSAYRKAWKCSLGQASKVVTALEKQGLIRCQRHGRDKIIVWAHGAEPQAIARAA